MASMAEQLAANINFSSLGKAEDLKKRLWFTLAALVVYRLGTYIPLPGIDAAIMAEFTARNSAGILGIFNRFSGGALGRMSILALGVMPYISASIIMQLMTVVSPHLEALKKEGESGRKKINQYTRYGTVLLASVQGYFMAVGLESAMGAIGPAVVIPGMMFRIISVFTFTGGTLFLMWLGEQITRRGVGNGISLIIFSGIVANLPSAIISTLEQGRAGALSPFIILGVLVMIVSVITFIVFIERSQRRVLVQYPKRQVGNKVYGGQSSHLPIKLNSSGVIPPIFASALLGIPVSVLSFMPSEGASGFFGRLSAYLQHDQPLYFIIFISLISFFAFFYTSIIFNPEETAENLKKNGGFVPGYRPGKNTADHFDYILTRLTVFGAIYLSAICVIPELFITQYGLPFYLGGTSLLIVVGVGMDTMTQIQSHLLAHQYEGLLKKSRLKGRKN